jgi:hypothetical protein
MPRAKRRWESLLEDDPGAGLLNLFDVWIAFSVALLLALVSDLKLPGTVAPVSDATRGQKADAPALERLMKKGIKIERYRVTRQSLSGDGIKLGTAYRLKTGEVVYVPDDGPAAGAKTAAGR